MIDGILAGMLVVLIAFCVHAAVSTVDGVRVNARMNSDDKLELPDLKKLVVRFKPVSQRAYERQLPAVLDSIALSLYSGSGFTQAIREASNGDGPVVNDMKAVVHEIEMGESLTDALQHWGSRVGYQSVSLCAASMVMAIESGGNYVVAVDAACAAVRRSLEAAATAKTNATQSRASAAALVLMPLIISGPLIASNGRAREFMFHSVIGITCLVAGTLLDVLGWLWMEALVKRTLS